MDRQKRFPVYIQYSIVQQNDASFNANPEKNTSFKAVYMKCPDQPYIVYFHMVYTNSEYH